MLHPFDTSFGENRLVKLGYGAASPLWAPFVLAAGMGAGFWLLSQWTRQSFAAQMPGAAPSATVPAPRIRATEEAPTVTATPEPVVQPEPVIETLAPAIPAEPLAVDVAEALAPTFEPAPAAEPEAAAEEPAGRAALMAETSVAALGETASFGGDVRADENAAPSATAGDDGADLIDAAYAQTLGPVPAPETPVQVRGGRKRRNPPGVAPTV